MAKRRPEQIMWDHVWKYFSLYIRLRDKRCITCQKIIHYKLANAGHYLHKSKGTILYFDERNVHKQCVTCNKWNHGEGAKYSKKIIELYGIEVFNWMHREIRKQKKWKLQELTDLRDKYKLLSEELLKNTF